MVVKIRDQTLENESAGRLQILVKYQYAGIFIRLDDIPANYSILKNHSQNSGYFLQSFVTYTSINSD